MVSMTGKEMIIYILEHDLENEVVFENGVFKFVMSEYEAATKFEVGVSTIRTWYHLDMMPGFKIGDVLYFRKDVVDPRIKNNQGADCNG